MVRKAPLRSLAAQNQTAANAKSNSSQPTEARLREFVEQFRRVSSRITTRGRLRYIVRSACSQNANGGRDDFSPEDYIGNWFFSFREQLMFPTESLEQFLARCREFTNLVQTVQFRSYALPEVRDCSLLPATPPPEHVLNELEGFREDYNAFLRNLEPWAKRNRGIPAINWSH